jgi:hypothetical protein
VNLASENGCYMSLYVLDESYMVGYRDDRLLDQERSRSRMANFGPEKNIKTITFTIVFYTIILLDKTPNLLIAF